MVQLQYFQWLYCIHCIYFPGPSVSQKVKKTVSNFCDCQTWTVVKSIGGAGKKTKVRKTHREQLQTGDDIQSGTDIYLPGMGLLSEFSFPDKSERKKLIVMLYGIFNNPLAKFHFFGYTYLHRKPFSEEVCRGLCRRPVRPHGIVTILQFQNEFMATAVSCRFLWQRNGEVRKSSFSGEKGFLWR